jgi:hypothetical protein
MAAQLAASQDGLSSVNNNKKNNKYMFIAVIFSHFVLFSV